MAESSKSLAYAAIPDGYGRYLIVRKAGTKAFEFPGGVIEKGESPEDTIARECERQVGVTINKKSLTSLGEFTAPDYDDSTVDVYASVYLGSGGALALPYDGIDALIWAFPGAKAAPEEGRILSPLVERVFSKLRPGIRRLRRESKAED